MSKVQVVKIVTKDFVADIKAGLTKTALMEKYKIDQGSLKKAVADINAMDEYKANPIKVKKEYKPKYQLINEEVTTTTQE